MTGQGKVIRVIINAAIFICMEIAALNMLQRNGISQNFFLARQRDNIMGGLWRIDSNVRSFLSLKKTNEELKAENTELYRALKAYQSEKGSARLDSVVAMRDTVGGFRYMSGTVVKISRNSQHNYLILGEGSEDGVRAQTAIITPKGVVGIVDTVSRHHAYAVSLMNKDLNVSAKIGTNGSVGPLSWDGMSANGATLREIPLQCKFQPGDTVFTSGFSSIFPADIPLGIAGESKIINGATYEISVTLLQGFHDVRHVILATNTQREEIEELERKQERQVR